MKSKRLIRFYFSADKLNGALDNLIMKNACGTETNGEECVNKIIEIIEAKKSLSKLWRYLDSVISGLSEFERSVLKFYGIVRLPLKKLGIERQREVKRVIMKFCRRARFLERYEEGIGLVNLYFALF